MISEGKFRFFLILVGWGGVCLLLYLFLFSPSTEPNRQTHPNEQKERQKVASSLTESPPPTNQQQKKDPFQLSFSETDIKEAKAVVQQFVDLYYEGERMERETFINQLKPYATDSYLDIFRQSNGLGEAIKINEKHVDYIELERSPVKGAMSFHVFVITENEDYFSSIYYLINENGKWKITEEGDGIVPEK